MPREGLVYRDRTTETFCGFAFWNNKNQGNVGTSLRTASALGIADFFCTIGDRYTRPRSDTIYSNYRHPVFSFKDFETFIESAPQHCQLIAVEQHEKAVCLSNFEHPQRALYIFGAEDEGIPKKYLEQIKHKVCLPSPIGISMNLSACASIIMWDRYKNFSTNS